MTETRVHRDELRQIANELEGMVKALLGAHPGDVVGAGAFGNWDAAQSLYPSIATAHGAITDHHARFLSATTALVKKLRETAHIYDKHEAAIEAQVREVERQLLAESDRAYQSARPGNLPPAPAPTSTTRPGSAT